MRNSSTLSFRTLKNHAAFFIKDAVRYYRQVFQYGAMHTPSQDYLDLLPHKASQLTIIKKFLKNILYHSTWHTHLFFLALIAYHQKQHISTREPTREQHGIGWTSKFPACHSSFLPNYMSFKKPKTAAPDRFVSLIQHSFLGRWNSMTVCCPDMVNRFDSFLERYRDTLIAILTAVSLGTLTPDQGLTLYFQTMHIVFLQSHVFIDKQKNIHTRAAAKQVIALQKQGIFRYANANFTPSDSYIRRILDIKRNESRSRGYKKLQRLLLSETENNEVIQRDILARFNTAR